MFMLQTNSKPPESHKETEMIQKKEEDIEGEARQYGANHTDEVRQYRTAHEIKYTEYQREYRQRPQAPLVTSDFENSGMNT
ncbi:hypothetical protein A0J61_08956 [Choanephora cucurbitarum]|uniref:Uncharacterized protein n=1 Tax=Choanephora cucurbitarum TaxID=101091 RepID=A0A1C7N6Q7_9FUNG|nr:hypothetical protein A0J61_08956 [Choanephora cucurbitarum]